MTLRLASCSRVVTCIVLHLCWETAVGHAKGAPNCTAPGGPHRKSAEADDGGHSLTVSSAGSLAVVPGLVPFKGFLLLLPEGVQACEYPDGVKSVASGDCVGALTHSSKRNSSDTLHVQLGCSKPCSGAVVAFLLTSLKGPWYNISVHMPGDVQPCYSAEDIRGGLTTDALGKEEAKKLAKRLFAGDKRLVRRPVLPATVEIQEQSNSLELYQRLADALRQGHDNPSLQRYAAISFAGLASGATSTLLSALRPFAVEPLLALVEEWVASKKPGSIAVAAAAEALASLFITQGTDETCTAKADCAAKANDVRPLCAALADTEATPTIKMWSAAALAQHVRQNSGSDENMLGLCPSLSESIVEYLMLGVVHCPMPSCTPPSLTNRAAMSSPDVWPADADTSVYKQSWIVTWAVLELTAALAAKDPQARNSLIAIGTLPALCFLHLSPDTFEGDYSREALALLATHLGATQKAACTDAEQLVRDDKRWPNANRRGY